jgi:tetratricopeptide (TPR) repeat protein
MGYGFRGALVALALLAAMPAHAAWQEASSAHFVVYSDDTPDKVSAFATDLERFDAAMRHMRGLPADDPGKARRVTVYVVRSMGAVAKLAGSSSIAGFYVPRVQGSVAFVPRSGSGTDKTDLSAAAVLRHEYAHHFMFDMWGGAALPAWFVEGFAEFNATTRSIGPYVVAGEPPLYRAYGLLATSLVPMRELLTRSPQEKRMSPEETQTFYGRAWLLTHYLSFDKERVALLGRYLRALNDGQPLAQAATLLGDPRKLDAALNKYAMQPHLPYTTTEATKLTIAPVIVRAVGPGEAAIMPVRIRSTRGVDARTAPAVAVDARKVAAAYPDDPAVQIVLAETELDAGRFEAADAAAAKALAAVPTMTRAMMYRGMAQGAIARRDKVSDPERWRAVRRWYVRANAADHDDPWPLVAFYTSYLQAGLPVPENAEAGLETAYLLARFDRGLTMMAAALYLKRNDAERAKLALRAVAYDPHGGGMATAAGAVLALVEKGDMAAAKAALNNTPQDDQGEGGEPAR